MDSGTLMNLTVFSYTLHCRVLNMGHLQRINGAFPSTDQTTFNHADEREIKAYIIIFNYCNWSAIATASIAVPIHTQSTENNSNGWWGNGHLGPINHCKR